MRIDKLIEFIKKERDAYIECQHDLGAGHAYTCGGRIDAYNEILKHIEKLQKESHKDEDIYRTALQKILSHRVNHFPSKEKMVQSMFDTDKEALDNE